MKRLLVTALTLFSINAAAQSTEWIARAPNRAGGQMVLLSIKGSCNTGLRMYTAASSGNMSWGCWFTTDTHVMVFWDEGETRNSAFEYGMWQINPALPDSTPAGKPRTTF